MKRRAPVRWPGQLDGPGHKRWVTVGASAAAVLTAAVLVTVTMLAGPLASHHGGADGPAPPGPASTPTPRPLERLPVGTAGNYTVARHDLVLVERSRSSLGTRRLHTVIRFPVIPVSPPARLARGLFPLVIFAPGYLQCGSSYRSLLRTWASAGYVVAAVDFPRTSCRAAQPDENDLVHQPADIAFVIRRLLAISQAPSGALSGLVNPARIAVAGHSDGGDTVAAVAAGTCCADRRVTAAIVLAGAEWAPLGGSYFIGKTVPVLFVQGDADSINPPADSLAMYRQDRTGPRFYLDLLGASHLPPYEGHQRPESLVARVTTAFLDRYLAGQRRARLAMTRAGNVAGVAALVAAGRPPPSAG